MQNLIKTNHFYQRAWQRGYHQSTIDKITARISECKGERLIIVSGKILRGARAQHSKGVSLIIKMKGNVLITLFEERNLFAYFQNVRNCEHIELLQ